MRCLACVSLSVALVVSAAAPAVAQLRPGTVEVGLETGRFFGGNLAAGSTCHFPGKTSVDNDQLGGFWLGARLGRGWGVEVAVRRSHTHLLEPGSGVFPRQGELAVLDFSTIEAAAERSFVLGHFFPYLAGGLGIASLDIDVADRSVRESDRLSLVLGGGARFFMASWAGLRFDLRGRGVYLGRRCHGDEGWRDHGRWLVAGEVAAGVFASFGGKP